MPIYLNYNASTPVDPAVASAMRPFLEEAFGNPSSGQGQRPPCACAAQLLAPIENPLGRATTFGAAFIVVSARKPPASQA